MLERHPLVRTIYLYLFTIIGLALLVSGAVKLIDMGLKVFVFTKADDDQKLNRYYNYPISPISSIEKLQVYQQSTSSELSAEDKAAIKGIIEEYRKYQEDAEKFDYLASQRQREASNSLAMIMVGLPLYLYHWRIIKKETKEENKG